MKRTEKLINILHILMNDYTDSIEESRSKEGDTEERLIKLEHKCGVLQAGL